MSFWHTAATQQRQRVRLIGRTASALDPDRRADMIVNIAESQTLAVRPEPRADWCSSIR